MSITFEIEYLRKLKEDSRSCVYLEHGQEHLALHPFQLDNISNSIKELLNNNIAKYCNHLNGLLLGYDNIKLLSSEGFICDDSCFVHTDIEADFYVFKPEIDSTLQGVINKIIKDHVACLVHKTFTISLPKPEHAVSWIGNKAQIGQEVRFTIVEADFAGSLPYIRGNIISLDTIDDSGFSTNEDPLGNEEYQLEAPTQMKAIKKRKLADSIDQTQDEGMVKTKRKKRKKEKIILNEEVQEQSFKKDKRKKKSEHDYLKSNFSTINKDDPLENGDSPDMSKQEPKSKKRKRKTSMELIPTTVPESTFKEGKKTKRKTHSLDSHVENHNADVSADSFSSSKKNGKTKKRASSDGIFNPRHHKNKSKSKQDDPLILKNDAITIEKSTDKYEDLPQRLSLEIGDNLLIEELNDLLSEKRSKSNKRKKL